MTNAEPRHGHGRETDASTEPSSHRVVSQDAERRARSGARSALIEWACAVTVLIGCAAATAGVIAIVLDNTVAVILIVIGAAAVLAGAVGWTVVVKHRHPRPRAAKREF